MGLSMDSYAIIRQAVLDRCSLTAMYEGRIRHFSPHCLGTDKGGGHNVLGFQYGGQTTKRPLPPGGSWRCFNVGNLSNVVRNKDAWHAGFEHSRPNTCVSHVDVEAR